MAIPQTQGAAIGSRDTYATVQRALEAAGTGYSGSNYKVFLQGSYGNDTNIWAESDVEVVIRLDSIYYYDTSLGLIVQRFEFPELGFELLDILQRPLGKGSPFFRRQLIRFAQRLISASDLVAHASGIEQIQ